MKTAKVKLPFSYDATAIICSHCSSEYVVYRIWRREKDIEVWPQVGGYCYMCGKDTKEKK